MRMRSYDIPTSGTDIEPGYEKALKNVPPINPEDFSEVFSVPEIKKDIEESERKEKEYRERETFEEKENYKFATVLEAIICDSATDWYGERVTAKKAAKPDDFERHVDVVLQIEGEESGGDAFAVAVDVTFGKSQLEKLLQIKKEIEEGSLGEIKYFDPKKGKRQKVPHVVIGAKKDAIAEMNGMWVEEDESLKTHWAAYEFLAQMLIELHIFKEHARTEKNKEAEKIYGESSDTIRELLSEMKKKTKTASAGEYTRELLMNLQAAGFVCDFGEIAKLLSGKE